MSTLLWTLPLIYGVLWILGGFKVLRSGSYIYTRHIGLRMKEKRVYREGKASLAYGTFIVTSGAVIIALGVLGVTGNIVDVFTTIFWTVVLVWVFRMIGLILGEVIDKLEKKKRI